MKAPSKVDKPVARGYTNETICANTHYGGYSGEIKRRTLEHDAQVPIFPDQSDLAGGLGPFFRGSRHGSEGYQGLQASQNSYRQGLGANDGRIGRGRGRRKDRGGAARKTAPGAQKEEVAIPGRVCPGF